ncbi:MAG: hypothetical protein U0132_22580 [Gemmatimonadaceae bacterium]
MWSVLSADMHYIRSGKNRLTGDEYRKELYDVSKDPLEREDIARTDAGQAWLLRLRATLDSVIPPDLVGRRPIPSGVAAGTTPASR